MKKRVITLVLTLVMLLSISVPAAAKSCSHDYGSTDVCSKCGHLRVHSFDRSITFYTAKQNVPVWSQPTKYSDKVTTITEQDTLVEIDGILRNKYENIWLKVAGETQYIYIDNLYLWFESLVVQNLQMIIPFENKTTQLAAFYDAVKPGSYADYKCWLDPGNKQFTYKVRFGTDNYYDLTAEELGNIHYGYLGRAFGLDSDGLLYAGGVVNQILKFLRDPWNAVKEISDECTNYYCDTEEDATDVKRGIDYFDTGVLNN